MEPQKGGRELTLGTLVVLEQLEGAKGSSTGQSFVAELGLVWLLLVVDLLVLFMRFACGMVSSGSNGRAREWAAGRPTYPTF